MQYSVLTSKKIIRFKSTVNCELQKEIIRFKSTVKPQAAAYGGCLIIACATVNLCATSGCSERYQIPSFF